MNPLAIQQHPVQGGASEFTAPCMFTRSTPSSPTPPSTPTPSWQGTAPKITKPNGESTCFLSDYNGRRVRLPCVCFDQQLTGALYSPDLIKPLTGSYDVLVCDEFQDNSEAKLRFLFPCLDSSDSNGGPGHRTKFSAVGDDDQSIHGWSGGLSNAFERLTDMIAKREGLPVGDPALEQCAYFRVSRCAW